jgi:hypothetical protein
VCMQPDAGMRMRTAPRAHGDTHKGVGRRQAVDINACRDPVGGRSRLEVHKGGLPTMRSSTSRCTLWGLAVALARYSTSPGRGMV